MPDRYRQRDGILSQRRHPPIRAEEAGRLIGSLFRIGRGKRDPKSDPTRLARVGAGVRARLAADPRALDRGQGKADLFLVRDFLTPAECDRLIGLIESNLTPSTLYREHSGDAARTSSTHYFESVHPEVHALEQRIDRLLGLERPNAETTQGQRYLPGEQYKHHCDFFRTERAHWQTERRRGGQRTWTAMVYLNAVEAGGETDFPALGRAFEPEPGLLIAWDNMDRKGRPNRATRHAGLPVQAGAKYVITQWYRLEEWSLQLR